MRYASTLDEDVDMYDAILHTGREVFAPYAPNLLSFWKEMMAIFTVVQVRRSNEWFVVLTPYRTWHNLACVIYTHMGQRALGFLCKDKKGERQSNTKLTKSQAERDARAWTRRAVKQHAALAESPIPYNSLHMTEYQRC